MLARQFSTQSRRLADFSHAVIGAGVVGLAVAAQLAAKGGNVVVIEKNATYGQETSSRNSEVVHAGLYYPKDSLKTELCIKGNRLLHVLEDVVPIQRCGKWIVAQNESQQEYLENLHEKAKELGVPTEFISLKQAKLLEPLIKADKAVLFSPTTSITSAHGLMHYLAVKLEENNGELAVGTKVNNIEKNGDEWVLNLETELGEDIVVAEDNREFQITSNVVINCAGLHAPEIANLVLPQEQKYESHYAKGNYFTWTGRLPRPRISRLIYPCPTSGVKSLGTHLTLDLGGQIRFGPDLEWVDEINYNVSNENVEAAKRAVAEYFPGVVHGDLVGTYSGIRPKLQGPEGTTQDFIVRAYPDNSCVHLLGIESPGLTASLALAERVCGMCS